MSYQSRAQVLGRLESSLEGRVMALVTGDRPGLETQVSSDQLVLVKRHLDAVGQNEWLNLVLYTRGGQTTAAWPLVNFLRAGSDKLRVLVPFYAHSAGTLMALGADEIMMTRFATLSPIDPTVANAFNPQDPANPAQRLPIAVEDVMAFLELAKSHAENPLLRDDAFRRLAESVHPLALGNVQRSINQIRQLARKMLSLHATPKQETEVEALVTALTTELYSHQHLVNRDEAGSMGMDVVAPPVDVETLLLEYYDELCVDLDLRNKWDPAAILRAAAAPATPAAAAGPAPTPGVTLPQPGTSPGLPAIQPQVSARVHVAVERGYMETTSTCDAFVTEGDVSQQVVQLPQAGMPMVAVPQQAIAFEVTSEDWRQIA